MLAEMDKIIVRLWVAEVGAQQVHDRLSAVADREGVVGAALFGSAIYSLRERAEYAESLICTSISPD